MTSTGPLLSFIGATGGCTLAALTLALQAGYECNALARTPSKLEDLLLKKGVPQMTLDSQLHITRGDVRDTATVKQALTLVGRPVDTVISGIGATSLSELSSSSLDLCATAIRNILTALTELKNEGKLPTKPLLVALSTTGITESRTPRDLPILMMPMYKLMLGNPHRDKLEMERVIAEHLEQDEAKVAILGFVLPRPSLLTNGASKGEAQIRVGLEDHPAVGYTISRDDVGLWVFANLIKGRDIQKYLNHKPTLTH